MALKLRVGGPKTPCKWPYRAGICTLTKTKDTGTAFADKLANTFDQVENRKGSVLPSTGGIGTTLFYIGGSILVLAAVILLVTKRRMANND